MKNEIKNHNYCVYMHISPSGKIYIGQTGTKPEYRWGKDGAGYLTQRNGKYTQPAFANAILKYGWDNFKHEIVATNLTKEKADILLIGKLKTMSPQYGYNIQEGGHFGRPSEQTRKKISEALRGNVISMDTRKKISKSLKGARTGADSANAKKVVQYDIRGNFIKIWDSIIDVERELGIENGNISKCCNDTYKTAGGYIWRYFGDELTKEQIDWCSRKKDAKRIAQYSLSDEFICLFTNMTEAELQTGIHHSNISNCCNGKRKSAGGFIWRYYEDAEEAA